MQFTRNTLDSCIGFLYLFPSGEKPHLRPKGRRKKMVKLTKVEKYKVEDIIGSIYGGVAIALDPIDNKELHDKIVNRLLDDLADLREALNLK